MMARRLRLDLPRFDLSTATWRARAIRYVVIYLALALALVGARLLTQDVRPTLREAQLREAALTTQRDELEVRVQALGSPQRVREWALQNGMRRFADRFAWQVESRTSWEQRPSGWPETRYERKARNVFGHEVWYFRFRRL